ncbi:NAD(P)/FAD-dependent oxidoreductase [Mesorhizobium sp. L-8-3]|uniref:NAD(P)/FAD-dependent oxidoreductase n=1 Tax=Mesorhizobium sp. L-8-3 TaxID=2744522 RepID=UPI0019287E3E|nr:FAD/NAD(P)-binding oxidoreductase [Mesorhizobium sp. L-8-3]BCH27877.1 (2Fe-2S)-binding protein [Mesorhizobium sp. L-8-3]
MTFCDVAIIGGGPAGMTAAIECARAGLSTILLDEQHAPGGQIYRAVEHASSHQLSILGKDYEEGLELVREFRACGAAYVAGATVWNVNPELRIIYSKDGASTELATGALVVASGAIERPTPMPGWTLPGVMTAGACQIMLKGPGLLDDGVTFVGSGPLLWLVAAQMITAGTKPRAIVETVPRSRYVAALRKLRLNSPTVSYLKKGAALMLAVKRAGIPIYPGATRIAVVGEKRAEAVTFYSSGHLHRIETALVALHQGVVPNQQISRLLRCDHVWNENQRCFVPRFDQFGETSVPNVFVAGDGGGIGGARAAALQGRIVGKRIAQKLGRAPSHDIDRLLSKLRAELSIRPFLEALYAPSVDITAPADETIICRCEETTAGQIRAVVDLGATGLNQVKSYLRNGMGPCQGRVCGLAATEIIAERRGETPSAVDYYRIRPPLKPLALRELAALGKAETKP